MTARLPASARDRRAAAAAAATTACRRSPWAGLLPRGGPAHRLFRVPSATPSISRGFTIRELLGPHRAELQSFHRGAGQRRSLIHYPVFWSQRELTLISRRLGDHRPDRVSASPSLWLAAAHFTSGPRGPPSFRLAWVLPEIAVAFIGLLSARRGGNLSVLTAIRAATAFPRSRCSSSFRGHTWRERFLDADPQRRCVVPQGGGRVPHLRSHYLKRLIRVTLSLMRPTLSNSADPALPHLLTADLREDAVVPGQSDRRSLPVLIHTSGFPVQQPWANSRHRLALMVIAP